MHYIKRITPRYFTVVLAVSLLTGCSLLKKEVPENTTQPMPTVTKEIPTTTPVPTTTLEEMQESPLSSEATIMTSPITEFLQQKDSNFTTITDFIKASDSTYLVLYPTSDDLEVNTYHLVLANPEADTYEIILRDTPLLYLQSIEDENSFTIVNIYQTSTDKTTLIPITPKISHFYRSESSFIEETVPYTISKNDPLFETYVFGDDRFDFATITELILENNTLRIRQQINTTSSDRNPVLTHFTYYPEENNFILSMECHDNIEILPQPEENSLFQTIFLSSAEEGSSLELSFSSDWDGQYYIQEELISQDEVGYTIDTILSLVPYIPPEEETQPEENLTE